MNSEDYKQLSDTEWLNMHTGRVFNLPPTGNSMNDLYNERIIRNGKEYRYDPDFDCYYAVPVKLSKIDQYAWIVLCLAMAAVAYWVEYLR